MSTPAYPSTLPGPSRVRFRPGLQVLGSDSGEPGPIDVRRRSRQPTADAQISFVYLEDDYATFVAWWRDTLLYGHRWFTLALPSAAGLVAHVVRFSPKYSTQVLGHRYIEVSASLEIRERQFTAVALCTPDPFFDDVVLALHFDGVDGGSVITDSSAYGRTPSAVVNATTSTEQPLYGSSTGKFLLNASEVRYASNTAFDFPGDFCIDGWGYRVGNDNPLANCIATRRFFNVSGAGTWRLTQAGFQSLVEPNPTIISWVFPLGVWTYYKLSRVGTLMRGWLGGVLVDSETNAVDYSNGTDLRIGRDFDLTSTTPWRGYLRDFRITQNGRDDDNNGAPPALTFCDEA